MGLAVPGSFVGNRKLILYNVCLKKSITLVPLTTSTQLQRADWHQNHYQLIAVTLQFLLHRITREWDRIHEDAN